MAIAWRRLADVPGDDPRPWLIATARNLLLANENPARQLTVLMRAGDSDDKVDATIKVVDDNVEPPGHLPGLVQSIKLAVLAAKAKSPRDLLAAAITENVALSETARNRATLTREFRANQTGEDRWRGL